MKPPIPPKLSLRKDCLAHPTPADLIMVQAVMIWPDDEAARVEANRMGEVFCGASIAHLLDKTSLVALANRAVITSKAGCGYFVIRVRLSAS